MRTTTTAIATTREIIGTWILEESVHPFRLRRAENELGVALFPAPQNAGRASFRRSFVEFN
jgi:hypothetical protein